MTIETTSTRLLSWQRTAARVTSAEGLPHITLVPARGARVHVTAKS